MARGFAVVTRDSANRLDVAYRHWMRSTSLRDRPAHASKQSISSSCDRTGKLVIPKPKNHVNVLTKLGESQTGKS